MDHKQLANRLAVEVSRKLDIQAKLGATLLSELERVSSEGRTQYNFEGQPTGTTKVPDRDWARCYGHYRGAIGTLLQEQREGIKLRAQLKAAEQQLTDDEYKAELMDLGRETLLTLTTDEIAATLKERGLAVVEIKERDE